jgi:hypothetical protein
MYSEVVVALDLVLVVVQDPPVVFQDPSVVVQVVVVVFPSSKKRLLSFRVYRNQSRKSLMR